MAWLWLVLAGLLEVAWAVGLKHSAGFSRPAVSAATVLLMIGSFWLLALALRSIPLGTGYAVWTGIGALGTALVGIVAFGERAEPRSPARRRRRRPRRRPRCWWPRRSRATCPR